ncbi:hypothetical protein UACE39S_00258 [Ureibacillus acetophenoni]
MAIGIFLLGAIHQFSTIEHKLGDAISLLLFLVWIVMIGCFFTSMFNKKYRHDYLFHSIKYFGAGTWIAGTSVICILVSNRFPILIEFLKIISIVNLVCWIIFICCSIFQLVNIIRKAYIPSVHGIILLTTVSTQSIACLLISLFDPNPYIILLLICIGLIFYLISLILISLRFRKRIKDLYEWKNTDCIIHGALSITGLALTESHLFSVEFLLAFWFVVFGVFIVVEFVEIIKAITRVRQLGIREGLLVYDVSQWARNFTFGMLYFFTYNIVNIYVGESSFKFQLLVMNVLAWVVLALLIIELFLLLKSKVKRASFS